VGRIVLIGLGFAASLAVAVGVAVATRWDAAVKVGADLYDHRGYIERVLAAPTDGTSLVVWLGDSTVAAASYPQLLAREWQERGDDRAARVLALPGLDFFDYYLAMGPVLDRRPDLVVLVAHLRLFGKESGSRTVGDLASMIPARELPRAMTLPLYDRGITIPRLLVSRTLRFGAGERAAYFFEGLRSTFQHADFWAVLGPRAPSWDVATGLRAVGRFRPVVLSHYDVPVSPRLPIVRMVGATVDMAVRHGVPAVVIGSPIPVEALREQVGYDAAVYARRFAVLRQVVEAAGGTFLDLHEALGADEFADTGGHYNERGVRRLGALVEPVVLSTLRRASAREPVARATDQRAPVAAR
jgi:hypothetical protein